MSSVQTPSPRTQPLPKLAEARAVTLRDHVLNIFHLVIKELRSIRSDPTMLILVVYAFSISVNTVATGAVTEATNLSVGIADEDGSELSRQIAEGLVRPTFQPAVQIRASDIDPKMDQGELLFRRRNSPELPGQYPCPAQDRDSDQRRCDRGRAGRQRCEPSQDRHFQRGAEFPQCPRHLRRLAYQPGRARRFQSEFAGRRGSRR